MTRKEYDKVVKYFGFKTPECEVVQDAAQRLLENLYCPCDDERDQDDIDWVADIEKVKRYKLDEDAINWGDLDVVEVVKVVGTDYDYLVSIEEVAPHSQHLINYVETYLRKWGWRVRVETEW